ncbi:MAG: FAD:protein FMN transferase [Thermoguttaceae bacterium]
MKRRELLFPLSTNSPTGSEQGPVPLVAVSRELMGGEFEVSYNGILYPDGTVGALAALNEVQRLEQKLSVFRPESQIEYINKVAAFEPVPLDEELYDWIDFALSLSRATEGAIDLTSTPLWRLWGFAQHSPRLPSESEISQTLKKVGYQFVELDPLARTIRFNQVGVSLNFGSIGKGLALDLAEQQLQKHQVADFILHGGFSSVLARGNFRAGSTASTGSTVSVGSTGPGSLAGKAGSTDTAGITGWPLGIAHPLRPGERLLEIALKNEAVGTSGSQKQFFRAGGRRFSHILDPRTGYPAEHHLMVSVVAPTGLQADALSTAFFVMKTEEIERYCSEHPEISVLAVSMKRSGHDIDRTTWGPHFRACNVGSR